MRLVLVAAVAAVMSVSQSWSQEEPWLVERPPDSFIREPTEPYRVVWTSQEDVNHACRGERAMAYIQAVAAGVEPRNADAYACTDVRKRLVLVVSTIRDDHPLVDQVLQHEKAHLNGWRHPPRN